MALQSWNPHFEPTDAMMLQQLSLTCDKVPLTRASVLLAIPLEVVCVSLLFQHLDLLPA